MKTITITKTYNVFKYEELSELAKENVKENYLTNYRDAYEFEELCKENLKELFRDAQLNVQFDLSYCQGSGFNIYGKIDLLCLLEIEEIFNKFSDKEHKTIQFYLDSIYSYYILKKNKNYSYCIIQDADIEEFIIDNLQENYYKNINYKLIKKFADFGKQYLINLCSDFEKFGYDYFYKVDDEEIIEMNEYYLENGLIFQE